MKIFTIGVYGSSAEEFWNKLTVNHIDTFCDIRQRRGVRGSKYAFVNSKHLQEKLFTLGINYIYEKRLAPTKKIREMQWAEDLIEHQTKKTRNALGNTFCREYNQQILDTINFDELLEIFKQNNAQNIVLFCVESRPEACHRSLVAQRLAEKYHLEIVNL